jgi:hypothetical protein
VVLSSNLILKADQKFEVTLSSGDWTVIDSPLLLALSR